MRTALLFILTVSSLSSAAAQIQSGETFKSGVTVIQVPVVVRDRDGHVVSNLGKDDFQLFDNGKRQEDRQFLGGEPRADGRFHQLKVKLGNSHKLTVEARKGYYAQ